ncbi:methyl-accepting chemotaxis protein [Domibacillus epiphyticus]|nr:methyl-accepting chemotaxis protein [Domibacillus epiphyticus]
MNTSSILTKEVERAILTKADDSALLVQERLATSLAEINAITSRNTVKTMDWKVQKLALQQDFERLDYLAFAVVTPDGKARYLDESTLELGDRDYVKRAFEGESNVSDVIISRATNLPVVMITSPIKDGDKVIGALVARMDAEFLSRMIDDIKHGDSGTAFIVNKTGMMVANPDRQTVIDQVNYIELAKKDESYAELAKATALMTEENHGVTEFQLNGTTQYLGFSPIDGTDWAIGVGVEQDEILAPLKNLRTFMIIATGIILLIGLAVISFISRNITKPIITVTKLGEYMSKNDFTHPVPDKLIRRKDEVGILANVFHQISDSMKSMIVQVRNGSEQVLHSSQLMNESARLASDMAIDINDSIREVDQGSAVQVQSAEESARAMEELSQGIQHVAESASLIASSSSAMNENAKSGYTFVQSAIDQMNDIQKGTDETRSSIRLLENDSREIGQIITVITNISGQTNLLALNAAIEAARAGEAGRGFSVVADEIRKLADQTTNSASQIQKLIENIQYNTKKSVTSIEAGTDDVNKGRERINEVGQKFNEILKAISEVTVKIEDMSAVSEEMSASTEQVAASVQEMAGTAQIASQSAQRVSNSSNEQLHVINEINDAATSLSEMSSKLNTLVQEFKVD